MDEANAQGDKMIRLVSRDDCAFELPVSAAKLSKLVLNSLPDDDDDDEDVQEVYEDVTLLRVTGACLEKIVEFLKHHDEEPMKEIPTPLPGNTLEEVIDQEWYQNYVHADNLVPAMLFDVLSAANYMEIKPLLDLACLKVTFTLKNKNAEEIRVILNLPEMTPEEEAAAREEHRWIFEESS